MDDGPNARRQRRGPRRLHLSALHRGPKTGGSIALRGRGPAWAEGEVRAAMSVQLAKRNLEVSVREAGFDWIVEVERRDDFTVRLWNGPPECLRQNVIRG